MRRILVLTGVLGLVIAGGVSAVTVTATYDGVSPREAVTLHADSNSTSPGDGTWELNQSVYAGVFNFTVTAGTYAEINVGDDLKLFCIDLAQHVSSGNSYTWDVLDMDQAPDPTTYTGGTTIGSVQEGNLEKLFAQHYNTAVSGTNTQAAAFQIAVWEIVNEHWTTGYDTSAGSFKIDGGSVADQADTWLGSLASFTFGPGDAVPTLVAFVSDDCQDQMWLVPGGEETFIPEPLTMMGVLMGLGGIGAYMRKRRLV